MTCSLQESTGTCGGYLVGHVDGVELVLFREDAEEVTGAISLSSPPSPYSPHFPPFFLSCQEVALNPGNGTFLHELTYCSPPLHAADNDEIVPQAVLSWMEYHRVQFGFDHFVLYDSGGLTEGLLGALREYLDRGLLEVNSFHQSFLQKGQRAWGYALVSQLPPPPPWLALSPSPPCPPGSGPE